jgi:SAM-dependent methyltransferase
MIGNSSSAVSLALDSWQGLVGSPVSGGNQGPHFNYEFAQRLFDYEAMQPAPASAAPVNVEPYSLQWFVTLQNQRHTKHGRWIPKLLEFAKHRGETLLALGDGLGTDWVQYAEHGANVIVCGRSPHQLDLIRRNFQVRGLTGRFLHTETTNLPLDAGAADVACITSLPSAEQAQSVVREVFRVLKPGGKVLAVVPARFHVDFWIQMLCFWRRWTNQPRGPAVPGNKWTRGQLRQLFQQFYDHRVRRRQLRRSELPTLWRWLPLPLLARIMGRFLILKAFKPIVPGK